MDRYMILPALAFMLSLSFTSVLFTQGRNFQPSESIQESVIRQDEQLKNLQHQADVNSLKIEELIRQGYATQAGLDKIYTSGMVIGSTLTLLLGLDMFIRARMKRPDSAPTSIRRSS